MNGTRLTRPIGIGIAALLAVFSVDLYPVFAGSSVVSDAMGDAEPAYSDIVSAKVTEERGRERLFFLMELAGTIPKAPSEVGLTWVWSLDTDPNTAPGGNPAEFAIVVSWSNWPNASFQAFLVDRRSGSAINTPVEFEIDGATIKAYVDLSALGSPSSFRWLSYTKSRPGSPDFAPDSGTANWGK